MVVATIIPALWLIVGFAIVRAMMVRGRVIAAVALVFWVPATVVIFAATRPDLLFNPLDRFFMSDFDSRERDVIKPLIPAVFSQDVTRQALEAALRQYGYAGAEGAYSKAGPSVLFVCATEFQVMVDYAGDGVSSIRGAKAGWCL